MLSWVEYEKSFITPGPGKLQVYEKNLGMSVVMSNREFVTFPLVSWVRCCT